MTIIKICEPALVHCTTYDEGISEDWSWIGRVHIRTSPNIWRSSTRNLHPPGQIDSL